MNLIVKHGRALLFKQLREASSRNTVMVFVFLSNCPTLWLVAEDFGWLDQWQVSGRRIHTLWRFIRLRRFQILQNASGMGEAATTMLACASYAYLLDHDYNVHLPFPSKQLLETELTDVLSFELPKSGHAELGGIA